MDSDTKTSANPVDSTTEATTVEENKTTEENSESSEQKNVIDVIGNGQLVKKVFANLEKLLEKSLVLLKCVWFDLIRPNHTDIKGRWRWFSATKRKHMQNKFGWQIGRWNSCRRFAKLCSTSRRCWGRTRCWYGNSTNDCGWTSRNIMWCTICIRWAGLDERKRQYKIDSAECKGKSLRNIYEIVKRINVLQCQFCYQ